MSRVSPFPCGILCCQRIRAQNAIITESDDIFEKSDSAGFSSFVLDVPQLFEALVVGQITSFYLKLKVLLSKIHHISSNWLPFSPQVEVES